MTTTARRTTRRIITATQVADWFQVITAGLLFEICDICSHPAADLYLRLDYSDNTEVQACEHCCETEDLGYVAD